MCGRFVLALPTDDVLAEFLVGHLVHPVPAASWNVAPGRTVVIVTERTGDDADRDVAAAPRSGREKHTGGESRSEAAKRPDREMRVARWGLVPYWAKGPAAGPPMINARSETITERPAFRAAAARRRCLIPANGYYEWMAAPNPSAGSRGGTVKTPYYLRDAHDEMLAMAGIYEMWRDRSLPEGDPAAFVWTCAVITRAAPDALGHIHDRTPVIVPRALRDGWLHCTDPRGEDPRELLAAIPPPRLEPREVGRAVGNVRNDSPSLIDPVMRGTAPGSAGDPADGPGPAGPPAAETFVLF